jgi:alpha-D-xyloside xylohydrolase
VIPFSYNEATGTLTIGVRKGDFPGMQQQRSFKIVNIGKSKAMGFDPDIQTNTILQYKGKRITIPLF